MLLALPGTAFLYQGEELGLPEDPTDARRRAPGPDLRAQRRCAHGRDGCRVPLPWEREGPGFGFTSGSPWLPLPTDWGARSVEAQRDDPSSMLELVRAAIALRRSTPALARGAFRWIDAPAGCLAFERRLDGQTVCCTVNLSDRPITLEVSPTVLLASEPGASGGTLPQDCGVYWRAGS